MVSTMNPVILFIVYINCIIGITTGHSMSQSIESQTLRFEQCREGCVKKVYNNKFKNKYFTLLNF